MPLKYGSSDTQASTIKALGKPQCSRRRDASRKCIATAAIASIASGSHRPWAIQPRRYSTPMPIPSKNS
ncbi:hypothetical protein D3C78_1966660 [compost metagenome]